MSQNGRIRDGIVKCWNGCGISTRNPYMIDDHPYCPDCAAELRPSLVRERVHADHSQWFANSWKSRTLGGPGHTRRLG